MTAFSKPSRKLATRNHPSTGGCHPRGAGRAGCYRYRADRHRQDSSVCLAHPDETCGRSGGWKPQRHEGADRGADRELAVQIEENVRAYAKHLPVRMATVFGGVSERPQINALRSGVNLVVATPGRLIDLMGTAPHKLFRCRISRSRRGRPYAGHGLPPQIKRIVKALLRGARHSCSQLRSRGKSRR